MKQNYLNLIVVSVLVLLAQGMNAASVDPGAAQAKAMSKLQSLSHGKLTSPNGEIKLVHTEPSPTVASRADYYVFNVSGSSGSSESFVIVAGDDRVKDVLAWGEGNINMASLPDGLQWLLTQYKLQMESLIAHADEMPRPRPDRARADWPTVEPLLTCQWSQLNPFYDQCPTYYGSPCVTGCTATAMAQVMYYWKYPAELPALPSYITGNLNIEVPALPGTHLDWDNMLDNYSRGYTAEQGAAVATLMRYCGQACFMDYGPQSSGAHNTEQLAGLMNFGYSCEAFLISRDDTDSESWDAMLQEDLTASRPVLYVGYNDGGGHAFVIDGCADGKYHVNWGSGGNSGYFTLDMLGQASWAYNYYQSMLHGVCPDESGEMPVVYDFEVNGIYYKGHGEEATVVNRDYHYNSYQGVVNLPSAVVHDGKTYQVTAIAADAFRNCPGLERIDIPATVKTIGDNAFRNCSRLKEISIGRNVAAIGNGAFYECLSLAKVEVEDIAAYCHIKLESTSSSPFNYGASLYQNGEQVRELVIPGEVEDISTGAFYNATGITSVEIGEGVKRIGDYAFYGNSVKSLTLPASIEFADYAAFCLCEALEEITFHGDNLPMDEFVFFGCTSLKQVKLPEGQKELAYCTFAECFALQQIDLGHSMERIDAYAFNFCSSLEHVTIPATLREIDEYAFNGCTGLKSVEAASPESWCGITFANESANPVTLARHLSINGEPLQQFVVPEGVTAINDYAFAGCEDLTAVTVTDDVTAIGSQAFAQCKNLEAISMGANVKTIGEKAFNDCANLKRVDAADLVAWLGIRFMSERANPVTLARHLTLGGLPLQQLVVPEGITEIGSYTFACCEDLTDVTINDGVTAVGNHAFYQCTNLENVKLSNSVKSIGEKAFFVCTSLKRVDLGNAVEHIGNRAFASCMLMTDISCSSVTPPVIDGTACFSSTVFKKATLRVPARSVVAYRDADVWSQFKVIKSICNTAACDVNGDGEINLADVNTLIDAILYGDGLTREGTERFDVNGDGEINISDVNFVISAIMQEQ
ncbi:MAG: leucine-rich repeat protein [Muribaculaceae bacterium]|nr:leucine-rich repeat protein [Muribaculaceae bacterium]